MLFLNLLNGKIVFFAMLAMAAVVACFLASWDGGLDRLRQGAVQATKQHQQEMKKAQDWRLK